MIFQLKYLNEITGNVVDINIKAHGLDSALKKAYAIQSKVFVFTPYKFNVLYWPVKNDNGLKPVVFDLKRKVIKGKALLLNKEEGTSEIIQL